MTVLLKLLFLRCCEEKTRKIRTQLYSNIKSQIRLYQFWTKTVVQKLAGTVVSGNENSSYMLIDITDAKASRKPEIVIATPGSFTGYIDYQYDDDTSTKDAIKLHLLNAGAKFNANSSVRLSILCIWY